MTSFTYNIKRNQAFIKSDSIELIREHFSYPNEGAIFAKRRGAWYVPTRKYVITPTGKYDVGLTLDIVKFIKKELVTEQIEFDNNIKSVINPKLVADEAILSVTLRDYQLEIVDTCLKFGRGVVLLATAGGKTLTMANLLERLYKSAKNKPTWKVLVIVPDLGLVNQTFSDFGSYNVSYTFSKWTGNNNIDLTTNVIIANLGILQSDKSDISWIANIDILIIDEVHKCKEKNQINKLIKNIATPHKFGFTGTLPDNSADLWNICGKIGPTIYHKCSYDLRVENYISGVLVKVVKLNYKSKPENINSADYNADDPGEQFRKEFDFIFEHPFRNNTIKNLTGNIKQNTLILVDYIRHGEILYNLLSANQNKQVYFIRGDVDVEERDKVKKLIENNTNVVCIAISKIFSTGISINNLHYIIFASGGKAKIKILQSIGRGLRLHKSKSQLTIIDLADQLKYGKRHSEKRIELYKQEKIDITITEISES